MSIENAKFQFPIYATDDLSPVGCRFKVVTFGGAIAASTARAAGVLVTSTRSGEWGSVVMDGITKAVVGAAVTTLGQPMKITTSGFLIACASGDAQIGRFLGIGLGLGVPQAANSGDLATVFVDFSQIAAWNGL